MPINSIAYFTIDRNNVFTVSNLSGLTITSISNVPLDENIFIFAVCLNGPSVWLWDGFELIDGENLLPPTVGEILRANCYDEPLSVIAGVPANTNQIQGPVPSGTIITLPDDSRDSGLPQGYQVGQGVLEIFLNGQYLRNGYDWQEIGIPGSISTTFQILQDLVILDTLQLRIGVAAGYAGSSGSGGGTVTGGANVGTGEGPVLLKISMEHYNLTI